MPPDEFLNGLRPAGTGGPRRKDYRDQHGHPGYAQGNHEQGRHLPVAGPAHRQLQGVRRARWFCKVNSAEQKLLINQSLRIDFKMEVGAESQTVDVGAEAAPVETVNPTLGQSITGRALTNMP